MKKFYGIVVIILALIGLYNIIMNEAFSNYFDPKRAEPVYDINEYINEKGQKFQQFDESKVAYKMAVNVYGAPIFVDNKLAFKTFLLDYNDVLSEIKIQYHLRPIRAYSFNLYRLYSVQISTEDIDIIKKKKDIAVFLDIYDNNCVLNF